MQTTRIGPATSAPVSLAAFTIFSADLSKTAWDEGTKLASPVQPAPRIEYVPSRSVKVSFDKAWLADETDVERYLESMREALLEEIRKGKRIQI